MTGRSALSHLCSVLVIFISTLFGCAQYVIPKKIVVDGTTYSQNTAGINAAIRAVGSNSEVVLMPGSYAITAPIVIDSVQNMTLHIANDAKLLAIPEDFNGAISMLSITRSNFVRVLGEKGVEFKGSGTPRDCVTINAPGLADSIPVSHVEVRGISCTGTLDGIDAGDSKNFQMNTNDIEIDHNFVSGTTGPGQINVQATIGVTIHDNVLRAPRAGQDQIVCSIVVSCDVHNNVLTGFVPIPSTIPEAAIDGFFCQRCSWNSNTIYGTASSVEFFGDVYCDTCSDSDLSNNYIVGGMWGITCEICRNIVIRSNILKHQLNTAIQLLGTTSSETSNSLDSPTGLIGGFDVALSQDPALTIWGAPSVKASLNSSFTEGVIFEQDKSTLSPGRPDLDLLIVSSQYLVRGALGFEYCNQPKLQGACNILRFGDMASGSWTPQEYRAPVAAPFSSKSYAIVALRRMPRNVIHFSQLRADRISEYVSVENNKIIRPGIWGINVFEGNQHYSVVQNTCQEVGYGSSSKMSACVIISDVDEGKLSYLLQYGTVEGNQATAAVGAAAPYGIRAYALGNSVNDSLLVQANRWDVANPTFFSRVTHLILGPFLQAKDACAQDSGLLALPHNGCELQARKRSQSEHP